MLGLVINLTFLVSVTFFVCFLAVATYRVVCDSEEVKNKEKRAKLLKPIEGVFNPKEELIRIRQTPKSDRRQKLNEYKKKLANQIAGLAMVQTEVIQAIRKNPDSSPKELIEMARSLGAGFGMSKKQFYSAKKILQKYCIRRAKIRKARRRRYPDDKRIYRAAFGENPSSAVRVIESPFVLYFCCANLDDYVRIYFSDAGPTYRNKNAEKMNKSGGVYKPQLVVFGAKGIVAAEKSNAGRFSRGVSPRVYKHEEQHAINALVGSKTPENFHEESIPYGPIEPLTLKLKRFICSRCRMVEAQAHDELLAFFTCPSDEVDEVFRWLTNTAAEGGSYDYLDEERKSLLAYFDENGVCYYRQIAKEVVTKVLRDEYRELIRTGLNAFQQLLGLGFSREEAIAILGHEPLRRWRKLANRLADTVKSN